MPCGEGHCPPGVADVAVHIHAGQRAGRVVRGRPWGITVLVRVLVMTPMAGAAAGGVALALAFVSAFMLAFMLAIGSRFSPDGLNRQQDQQKDEKPTAHAGRIVGAGRWRKRDNRFETRDEDPWKPPFFNKNSVGSS